MSEGASDTVPAHQQAAAAAESAAAAKSAVDLDCFQCEDGKSLTLCTSTLMKDVVVPLDQSRQDNQVLRWLARLKPFEKKLVGCGRRKAYERILLETCTPFDGTSMLMLRRLLFSRGTVGNIRATLWKAALGYLPNGSISFVCAQHNTNAHTHTFETPKSNTNSTNRWIAPLRGSTSTSKPKWRSRRAAQNTPFWRRSTAQSSKKRSEHPEPKNGVSTANSTAI